MPTIANVELTEKEADLIRDILTDDYNSGGVDGTPWSWSVVGGSHSRAGVLASLVKKGLVGTSDYQGRGRADDQYCFFTDAGKPVAQVFQDQIEAEWEAAKADAPVLYPVEYHGKTVHVSVPEE